MASDKLIDDIIDAIKNASQSMDVCIPSQDYYSRSNDWQTETIHYIDPRDLISALELLK